jgi:hypothetical protein
VTVRLEVIEKSRPDVVYTAHVTPFIQAGKPANLQNQWLLSPGFFPVQQPQRKRPRLQGNAAGKTFR